MNAPTQEAIDAALALAEAEEWTTDVLDNAIFIANLGNAKRAYATAARILAAAYREILTRNE